MTKKETIKNDIKSFEITLTSIEAAKVSLECDKSNLPALNELNELIRS